MDAACTIQDSIHVFSLVHKYVSRILGTYQKISSSGVSYMSLISIREFTHGTGFFRAGILGSNYGAAEGAFL